MGSGGGVMLLDLPSVGFSIAVECSSGLRFGLDHVLTRPLASSAKLWVVTL